MQDTDVIVNPGQRCATSRLCMAVYVYTGDNYLCALAADAVYWSQAEESLETQLWRSIALQILTAPDAGVQMTHQGPVAYNNRRVALMEGGRGL